jgi:signal transduction histidine kinase
MSMFSPIPQAPASDPEHPLARAFASFTEAAGSLERTYGQLQGQVSHLRQELEVTNRDLARSLEENHRIRERLRRILEGLPCGVLVMEAEARVSILNPEAVRLLGGSFGSVDAMPAALSAALDRACQTGEEVELPLDFPHSGLEQSALDVDQSSSNQRSSIQVQPIWVAIRHAWLEQSQARATSVFILRDVSEAKKMELEREQLRRRQALVEVSALLAHEIRNPLGSLELFAGLLAEANLEGESRGWIEHVQAGLRTLSATVNNVLHLHDTPQPELTPTDAGELLDWAYGFLLPLAKQARVEMQVINGLHGIQMQADRHRLEQVLLNLALNAFRFMSGGGWFSIRGIDCAADGLEIVVRDTGPGIVPGDLPRIFEAGFTSRSGSSGLGLAVCHRILEQHGGSISVESWYGHGATFRLRIPRTGPTVVALSFVHSLEHSVRDPSELVSDSGAAL